RHTSFSRDWSSDVCSSDLAALLAVILSENVLLGGGQQTQAFLRRTGGPARAVEAVEQVSTDLVLLEHERDRVLLIERGAARPARSEERRVGKEGRRGGACA